MKVVPDQMDRQDAQVLEGLMDNQDPEVKLDREESQAAPDPRVHKDLPVSRAGTVSRENLAGMDSPDNLVKLDHKDDPDHKGGKVPMDDQESLADQENRGLRESRV